MSSLRKFAISYSHFFTGGTLNLLFGFITFPVLTRVLTREEYGILGLVSTTMIFTIAVAKAGLSDGIVRYYESYNETIDGRTQFASTIAIRGLVFSFLTSLLFLLIIPEVGRYLHIKHQYMICFIMMGGTILLSPLNISVLNVMRASGNTFLYNTAILASKVVSFGVSMFFFIYLFKEFYGYFVGLVFSELVLSFFLFNWFFFNYKVAITKVSGSLAMELIRFGFPLLVAELFYLVLSYADRYMIAAYKGEATLGLYSVGYNIASYLSSFITFPLSYAIVPSYVEIYEKNGRKKTEEFLQKCMHYLLICIFPILFGFYAISKDLFITLASEKFAEASSFSPIILLGTFFLGMNNILNAGLYLNKKSRVILFIMLAAVMTNICLNIYFIPRFDATGAAIATLISCVLATVLTVICSYSFIVVKVDIKDIFYYILFSFIMYAVITHVHTNVVWVDLIAKVILGVVIMMPAILLREKEIRIKVRSMFPLLIPKSRV